MRLMWLSSLNDTFFCMCFCLVAERMRYNFEDWNVRAGVFGYCDVGAFDFVFSSYLCVLHLD